MCCVYFSRVFPSHFIPFRYFCFFPAFLRVFARSILTVCVFDPSLIPFARLAHIQVPHSTNREETRKSGIQTSSRMKPVCASKFTCPFSFPLKSAAYLALLVFTLCCWHEPRAPISYFICVCLFESGHPVCFDCRARRIRPRSTHSHDPSDLLFIMLRFYKSPAHSDSPTLTLTLFNVYIYISIYVYVPILALTLSLSLSLPRAQSPTTCDSRAWPMATRAPSTPRPRSICCTTPATTSRAPNAACWRRPPHPHPHHQFHRHRRRHR
jgi:hypothetical protein